MKKILIVAALVFSFVAGASAQEGKTAYPAMMEISRAKASWFKTSNAAGMVVTPLYQYADLSVGYKSATGEFRRMQEGDVSALNVNTSGTGKVGGFTFWGEFDYNNVTSKETKFRTMNIDLEDDMPFYVADRNMSEWKHQAYELKAKVATPLLWDRLSFGVYGNYYAKSGAKQIDPRCTDYLYGIVVEPSALLKLGKHNLGLTFKYKVGHDRTVPVNSNNQQDQNIFIMRGLGNYTEGVIGGIGGLSTFYYNLTKIGGAFQYGFATENFNAVAEAYYTEQAIDVRQTPSKPQAMGSTFQKIAGGSFNTALNCGKNTHSLSVNGLYRKTNGIEYVQVLNTDYEVQMWETISESVRSTYELTEVDYEYNFFRNSDYGYNWMAGLSGSYSSREDKYLTPEARLKITNFFNKLFVKKNIMLNEASLVVGIEGGYNHNIDKEYNYSGPDAEAYTVQEFYLKDCSMMGAHYWMIGANVNVTFPVMKNALLYIKGSINYCRSNDKMNNHEYTKDSKGNYFWYIEADANAHRSQRCTALVSVGISF